MVEVGEPRVQVQEFLGAFPPFEALLTSFLSSCRSVFLLNEVVAAGSGDYLLVVDICQARDLPDRGSITPELIGMDNLRDIVFSQQSCQEGLRRFGIPMPLEENVEHEAVLVHSPP